MTRSPADRPPWDATGPTARDDNPAAGPFPGAPAESGQQASRSAHPRFAAALRELGLVDLLPRVRHFPDGTRTAAEAAAAIGCAPGQICKSLLFASDGVPVLVLVDGASRVDVELVRRELGAAEVARAGADLVRKTTGYAIGGVPPFGHRAPTRVLADRSLLAHDTVWAAAGTPHAVFPMDPASLVAHAGGILVDDREQSA